jgi:RNA polymerase sigma-70 factor (ECF subfamily)
MSDEHEQENEYQSRKEIRENYSTVMRVHSIPLLSFLTRYLANSAAASDIAQDAFVKAYFNLDHFDESRSFSKWLYTIAGNLARDHIRQQIRQASRNRHYVESWSLQESQSGITKEEAQLERALIKLPDGLREPIVLHYQMDWSVDDISRHLKITQGAVKVRLFRAREELRRIVQEFEEGENHE